MKKLISFKQLQNICVDYRCNGHCWDRDIFNGVKCTAKICPIWKKLKTAEVREGK